MLTTFATNTNQDSTFKSKYSLLISEKQNDVCYVQGKKLLKQVAHLPNYRRDSGRAMF